MREESVRRFADHEALSAAAAAAVVAAARAAVAARGRFRLVLAGGESPRRLYELLATPPLDAALPWGWTTVFFGDERAVPPDHPASNYGRAASALLDHVPVATVHRMRGEACPLTAGAEAYAAYVAGAAEAGGGPLFDLVLLGMGADGHTASLFPGSPALDEEERLVVVTEASPGVSPRERLTLTLPALGAAREIFVLVAGSLAKSRILGEILGDRAAAARRYPVARVRPTERLVWWAEESAA